MHLVPRLVRLYKKLIVCAHSTELIESAAIWLSRDRLTGDKIHTIPQLQVI